MEALRGVTLEAWRGEIVAVAGVEGNGQAELEEVLCGLRPATGGTIAFDGRDLTAASTAERLRAGFGIVPSDRYRRGLVRALPVADNLVLDRIGEPPFASPLRVRRRRILERAAELVKRYGIQVSRARPARRNALRRERAARRARADAEPRHPPHRRGAADARSRRRRNGVRLGTARRRRARPAPPSSSSRPTSTR